MAETIEESYESAVTRKVIRTSLKIEEVGIHTHNPVNLHVIHTFMTEVGVTTVFHNSLRSTGRVLGCSPLMLFKYF